MHVVLSDLQEVVVNGAVKQFQEAYPDVDCFGNVCDVTKPEALAEAVKSIEAQIAPRTIGAVFANAGVFLPSGGILGSDVNDWKFTFDVNVIGVVNTIKAFVPILKALKQQSIFSITASIGGLNRSNPGLAAYVSSKHAAVSIAEALSMELAVRSPQVRVHACCPCLVATTLNITSNISKSVKGNQVNDDNLDPLGLGSEMTEGLFMTPLAHGKQVWDRIAAGEFYMICDNVRPYVDHDFPFNGVEQVKKRIAPIIRENGPKAIDNAVAFGADPGIPLFKEVMRRSIEQSKL